MRVLIAKDVQTFVEVGPGKSSLRIDAANRSLAEMPVCRR